MRSILFNSTFFALTIVSSPLVESHSVSFSAAPSAGTIVLSSASEAGTIIDTTLSTARTAARENLSTAYASLRSQFSLDENAAALSAMHDALGFLEMSAFVLPPQSSLSDDGLVTLQWRNGNVGLMLVFAGDGQFILSEKELGGYYISAPREVSLAVDSSDLIGATLKRVFA